MMIGAMRAKATKKHQLVKRIVRALTEGIRRHRIMRAVQSVAPHLAVSDGIRIIRYRLAARDEHATANVTEIKSGIDVQRKVCVQ